MKSKKGLMLVGLLACLARCGADDSTNPGGEPNRWESLGPEGGWAQWLVSAPAPGAAMYAMAGERLFRLDDGAKAWSPLSLPSEIWGKDCHLQGLAPDPKTPKTLYLTAFCPGRPISPVFRSLDGGDSWKPASSGFPTKDDFLVKSLLIHPGTPSILYASCSGDQIYRSDDSGSSWRLLASPGDQTSTFLALDPRNPDVVFAGGDDESICYGQESRCGVLRSNDGGLHWTWLLSNFQTQFLLQHPSDPGRLFTGDYNSMRESRDGGQSWRDLAVPGLSTGLVVSPSDPDAYYATKFEQDTFHKSSNAGQNWETLTLGRPNVIYSLAANPSHAELLYAGTEKGVLRSADGGHSWSEANTGLIASFVGNLAVSQQKPSKVWAAVEGEVLASDDWGRHWRATGEQATSIEIDPTNDSILYSRHWQGVGKSTDGGQSWIEASGGLFDPEIGRVIIRAMAHHPRKSGTLYLWSYSGLFRSTNGGAAWESMGHPFQSSSSVLAVRPDEGEVLYSMLNGHEGSPVRLFRSQDGGAAWEALPGPLDGLKVRDLAIAPSAPDSMFAATEQGLFGSRDAGVSWSRLPLPPQVQAATLSVAVDARNAGLLVVGTAGQGTYSSKDGGQSWTALDSSSDARTVSVLLAHPGQPGLVYAGTPGNGVLRTRLSSSGD